MLGRGINQVAQEPGFGSYFLAVFLSGMAMWALYRVLDWSERETKRRET